MKVSIIVPVYNKAAYVEAAIQSAVGQSHQNIEIIAIDDGSTDESPAILATLQGMYPQLLLHSQQNLGLSEARNVGIRHATGQYLMFHDADDILELDAVAKLLEIAVRESSDVVGGVFRRLIENNAAIVKRYQRNEFRMNFRRQPQKAATYCTNFSSCNKLFSTAFLRRFDLYFAPGLYMQDLEFWLKAMFLSENISQSEHVVSNYLQYPDSSSHLRSAKRFESLFRLNELTNAFFQEQKLQDFSELRHHVLMQGALMFFAHWKLDEWNENGSENDLNRLADLLSSIPEENFVSFHRRNCGPNATILLLIRSRNYIEAARIKASPYSGSIAWRRYFGGLDSAQALLEFAKRNGQSKVRNTIYKIYYLTPYYLAHPNLLPKLSLKLVKRLVSKPRRDF